MNAAPSSLITPGISRSGRRCVFKQLRPEHRDREDLALRLANERDVLRLLAGVSGVVPLLEVRDHPLTLVLDRADRSLEDLLATGLSVPDAPSLALALLRAVANVHRRGVIHRDIKPSNILMFGDQPCLADFGVAAYGEPPRALPEGWEEDSVGTPPWSAPEQRDQAHQHISFAADTYSAARVVETLFGDRPLPAAFRDAQRDDPLQRPSLAELIGAIPR